MPLKHNHTLLLVDDEVSITKSLRRLFRKDDFEIHTASNGKEGLEVLGSLENVSLIISDQRMPVMTGCEFFEKAKDVFPEATRFLLTGYSDMDAVVDAVNKGQIHRYITKPWNDDELRMQVVQGLEQYELIVENRRLTELTSRQNEELKELNADLEKRVEERSKEILEKNRALASMNEKLESGFLNTVRAFASLAEMHAPELAGHGRRVSLLSREIAIQQELPDSEITDIEVAGLLHDVGKLGLPGNVLNYQEETWSEQNKTAYRKHPEEGQVVVRFIDRLDNVGALIRAHHERYDGLGYPDYLSEDSIPMGARIIAVANAYDKITRLRVNGKSYIQEYLRERQTTRGGVSEDELMQQAALLHLKKQAFSLYDPDVVKTLLGLLKTKGIRYKKEQHVYLSELRPGMVLSRSLYTKGGRFLLPHNTALTEDYIGKLNKILQHDPPVEGIFVMEHPSGPERTQAS
jgi:response regulator RpfG family c-di-GMP phosphodiesterase